jgi:hypothetical protein
MMQYARILTRKFGVFFTDYKRVQEGCAELYGLGYRYNLRGGMINATQEE